MKQTEADLVFVVEDDPTLRETLTEILGHTGCRVTAVANGMEAFLQLAQRAPADLPRAILLDLLMPVMNGWEFRRLMLQDLAWSRIPVIVTTALPLQDCKISQLAPTAVIAKPYEVATLLQHLEPYVRNTALPPAPVAGADDEAEHFLCSVAEAFALADAGFVDTGHQILLDGIAECRVNCSTRRLPALWTDALRRFRDRFGVRLH